MKKSILTLTLASFAFAFTSCRDAEPQKETVVIEKEVVKEVEKEDPGLLEEAAAEVDKEVNKEISEEIDKIGDDQ